MRIEKAVQQLTVSSLCHDRFSRFTQQNTDREIYKRTHRETTERALYVVIGRIYSTQGVQCGLMIHLQVQASIGNESVPIQLAQFWSPWPFPVQKYKYIFFK